MSMPDKSVIAAQNDLPIWRFMFAKPRADEHKFRQHYLDADAKQVKAITLTIMVMLVVMSLADIPQMTEVSGLEFGVVLRVFMTFLGAILILSLERWRSPRTLDIGVAGFALIAGACIAVFHMSADVSAARIGAIGTLFIFVANITFPVYSLYLLPAIVIFLSGETLVLFDPSREVLIEHRPIIVISFIFAEVMSIFASAHLQRTRFLAYRALSEIKTLSGMIPICSNCKKIRDDSGYYQQLEQYISSHSDARFSHGLCPDCIPKLYPEIRDRKKPS